MAKICTKDKNLLWHKGRIGGYLEDEDKHLYGITCRHVTQSAYDDIIYIKDALGNHVPFGKIAQRKDLFRIDTDMNLIFINEEMLIHCEKSFRNSRGDICPVRIYEETIKDISGCKVFLRSVHSSSEGKLSLDITHGIVASVEQQNLLDENQAIRGNFLVESTNICPGDSGNVLLMERDDTLYIVGMVVGGYTTTSTISEEFCLCGNLHHGKLFLEKQFGKTFQLPTTSNLGPINKENAIECFVSSGSVIWVKDPEDIVKSDFILFEHLITLIDCFGYTTFSTNETKLENYFEEQLSKHVNSRNESIQTISCHSDSEECFRQCMIGCQYIYSENFVKSDEHLKAAVRLISKASCRNRLLCKLITYSTWQLLETGKLDNMKKLLEDGESYMLKMKECNACPLKSIGYHYFDYARYYKRTHNCNEAMSMARKSLEFFELDEKYRGKPSHGKCFALSMIARLNLHCGENFETRDQKMIDIKEAEECIVDFKSFGKLPAVEKTSYLLVKTDLHYRKGEIEKAQRCARKCCHLAAQNRLKQELSQALIRIKELSKMLNK